MLLTGAPELTLHPDINEFESRARSVRLDRPETRKVYPGARDEPIACPVVVG